MLVHKNTLEIDNKNAKAMATEEEKRENNIWSCWHCSEYIYLDDDPCICEGRTTCINCLCSCTQCGKYDEKKYIKFLNGSKVKRYCCDNCCNYPHVKPIDISNSIDWIKNSKQKFNKVEKDVSHQGPIITSNWITDKICVGGYPKTRFEIERLIKSGVNVFVCLNGSDKSEFYKYERQLSSDKTYINVQIEDMSVTTDDIIHALCERIVIRIRNGDKLYIHCTGGHGRTGTVAAVTLYMLYKLSLQQIYDYLQFSHDQRIGNYFGTGCYWTKHLDDPEPQKQCFAVGQVPTPQASCQRQQVERIITKIINKKCE